MLRKIANLIVLSGLGFMAPRADTNEPSDQAKPSHNPSKTSAELNAPRQTVERSRDLGVIPELLFEGGSVRELIDIVRAAADSTKPTLPPLNVIVAGEMQEANVPPFKLHNVTYADIFQALNKMNANTGEGEWQLSGSTEPIWILNSPPPRIDPMAGIDPLTGQPLRSRPLRTNRIYQLQRYLAKYTVEDITTAIQTTWAMMDLEKGTQLKYHKDTSLLIAVGTNDQLEIISQVLQSLTEGLAVTTTPNKTEKGEAYVNGAVNRPGSISLTGDQEVNILGAILRSGGLNYRANENKIKLTRPGSTEKTFTMDELKKGTKNIVLQPGDVIDVAERLF